MCLWQLVLIVHVKPNWCHMIAVHWQRATLGVSVHSDTDTARTLAPLGPLGHRPHRSDARTPAPLGRRHRSDAYTTRTLAPLRRLHHADACTARTLAPLGRLHHSDACTTRTLAPLGRLHHSDACTTRTLAPLGRLHHSDACTTRTPAPLGCSHHSDACTTRTLTPLRRLHHSDAYTTVLLRALVFVTKDSHWLRSRRCSRVGPVYRPAPCWLDQRVSWRLHHCCGRTALGCTCPRVSQSDCEINIFKLKSVK